MGHLIQAYMKVGIVQFGRFRQENGTFWPVAFNFLLLPSYPAVMKQTAKALVPLLHKTKADRLLTTRATIPVGAVLAVESDVPLTYPYGEIKDFTVAYAIEGAYDVGHPTALLTDVLHRTNELAAQIAIARKVGLEVRDVIALIAPGEQGKATIRVLESQDIRVQVLVNFADSLESLVMPEPLRETVKRWLIASEK